MHRPKAILLVGPVGVGKSPLGALLEKRMGWAHFDFGHQLRLIARGEEVPGLTESDRDYVKEILHTHSLFPDDKFHIVERILKDFIDRNDHVPGIILNGLPRHIGQARDISNLVDIQSVAVLECPKDVSMRRVERRLAGLGPDHETRADDRPEIVEHKYLLYTKRTTPLIDHYTGLGANLFRIPVGNGTSESEIASSIIKAIR